MMDLLEKVRQYIVENDIPSALAELDKETLSKNQQDDVLSFKMILNQTPLKNAKIGIFILALFLPLFLKFMPPSPTPQTQEF
jgi:hypothetical protein